MTFAEPLSDSMSLVFIDPTTGNIENEIVLVSTVGNINDYTAVNFQKDYFTPSNQLSFEIEDDRVFQLNEFLQRGFKVKLSINGNQNMFGYIFDYDIEYTRGGGTKLTVRCKDLLEYMAQGSVYPNMGTNKNVNFHFKPTDTLAYALQRIANAFDDVTDESILIDIDDHASLTFASGFDTGIASKGKTAKGRQKSITSNLGHLTTPIKGESYLAYMVRLCKHAGCNLKMSNQNENVIIVKPPTYDRTTASPFKLIHYVDQSKSMQNNVLSAHYHFTLDKQPSVVIVESNSRGDQKFYQSILKGVALNELTAYPIGGGNNVQAIPSVLDAVAQLTNGQLGTGYVKAPFNQQLYSVRNQMAIDVNTLVSLPYYTVDSSAHTLDECSFAASMILAEAQDRSVEARFRVQGWTMAGTDAIWQPDMMVEITDDVFADWGSPSFPLWIRQVNYIKTKGGGTETELVCTLPYTHNFEILP